MSTFNHSSFIRESVQAALAQVLNEDFHIFLVDDSSSDGTAAIARELAEIHPARLTVILHEENQFSQGNYATLQLAATTAAEMVAFCDGDDVWIDSQKLAKQAAILRANPNCALVHTDFDLGLEEGAHQESVRALNALRLDPRRDADKLIAGEALVAGNFVMKSSVLLRKAKLDQHIHDLRKSAAPILDWIMWCIVTQDSLIGYLPDRTVRYRLHGNQSWEASPQESRVQVMRQAQWNLAAHLRGPSQFAMQQIVSEGVHAEALVERDHAIAERDHLRRRLDGIENSRIWRSTGWWRTGRTRLRALAASPEEDPHQDELRNPLPTDPAAQCADRNQARSADPQV